MTNSKVIGVVGSGFSSLACVSKLVLKDSIKIIILDNGEEPIDSSYKLKEDIKNKDSYIKRLKTYYDFIKRNKIHTSSNINKTFFGSSIFNEEHLVQNKYKLYSSNAYGGFSNVWGGVSNAPIIENLHDWPIKYNDLSVYFSTIAKILNLSGESDNLSTFLKFNYENEYGIKLSPIVKEWYSRINNKIHNLNKDDIYVGRSKLSLNNNLLNNQYCKECGMCMHGCPHDIIFNSRLGFNNILNNDKISYYNNYKVIKFKESNNKIQLFCNNTKTNNIEKFSFDYIFLAAGCINSSKIVINSIKELYNKSITIDQNDNYIAPFLVKKIKSFPLKFEKNTLSQLSVIINDKNIDKHGVYFQTYEFSDIVLFNIFNKLSYNYFYHSILKNFPMINRLLFAQFIFNSKVSNQLVMKLINDNFSIDVINNVNDTNNTLKKIINKLDSNINLNIRFIPFFTKKFKTGMSYHVGSSFKMKKNNSLFSTDLIGRPYKFNKISIVDSSILPSLPANSHTFLTMANCYRITDEIVKKEFMP